MGLEGVGASISFLIPSITAVDYHKHNDNNIVLSLAISDQFLNSRFTSNRAVVSKVLKKQTV